MSDPPIQSPSEQQAHDKIRGYNYQCWLTVEEWLGLGEQDILFTEAAEDFATFSSSKIVDIAQAKATAASITLRSDDTIEAINHYWAFCNQKSGFQVRYSFISTSQATTERGDPFEGTAGITLWQQASEQNDATKAELLLNFLRNDESAKKKLDGSLLKKLQLLSPSEFLEQFVHPVIWDIEHHDIDAVKENVISQLGIIAEKKLGVSSTHASNLSDTLFTTVHRIAESKEKVGLTLSSLNTTLEGYLAAINASINSIRSQSILAGTISGSSGMTIGWDLTDITPPLEIPTEFTRRESAIEHISTKAGGSPFILIEGSSGTGKSTLASIFAKSLGHDCLQFRSRGTEPGRILRGVQECIWLINNHPRRITLIIDDLPWYSMDEGGMVILRALARTATKKRANIIFTNHKSATPRQLSSSGFSELVTIPAPLMVEEEIIDLAIRLGCEEEVAKIWAPIVGVQTLKHPQLVHAHLVGLKRKDWPSLSTAELQSSTKRVIEEQTHAQHMLSLIEPHEIELLTRLSTYYGTFTKDHAMTIGESLEPLLGANVVFESLIGPWIEPQESGRYQITPLLGRSLVTNTSTNRQRLLNEAAADAIVSCKPLEARDAASALFNAIEGDASTHATGLVIQFLTAPEEHINALLTHISWIQFIQPDGSVIFEGHPALDYLIRILQFRVSAFVAPEKCEHFLALCDQMSQTAEIKRGGASLESILAVSIISTDPQAVSFSRIFWAMDVINSSIPALIEELGDPVEKDSELNSKFDSAEDGCIFTLSAKVWQRASSNQGLRELFDFLGDMSGDEKRFSDTLKTLTQHAALALGAFDEVWLDESKKEEPDWEKAIDLFSHCMAVSQSWGCELLTACSAHSISVIQDDYLNDVDKAAEILIGLESNIPEVRSIISEQKGKISLSLKQYEDAQAHFEESIEHNPWREYTSSSILNAYHNAGVSAAYAEDWESSASHFKSAFRIAQDDQLWTRAVGFAADAGYSFWEYGDKVAAVSHLKEALSLVKQMPSFVTDLASLQVQKILGNMLLQLNWNNKPALINKELSTTIVPGMCSNLGTNEGLRELTPPVLDFQWAFLLKIEFEQTRDSAVWEEYSQQLLEHAHPSLKFLVLSVKARKCLRDGSEESLLRLGYELATSLLFSTRPKSQEELKDFQNWNIGDIPQSAKDQIGTESPYPINFLLMCGITSAVFGGNEPTDLIKSWKQDIGSDELSISGLHDWLSLVENAYSKGVVEAFEATLQADTLWERWSAALKLVNPASEAKHDPTILLAASLAFLIFGWHDVTQYEIVDDAYELIDTNLSALWKKACENRYAFDSPTLFIPPIRELACNPTGKVSHIAELIIAAQSAVKNSSLPPALLDQVKELRESTANDVNSDLKV